MESTNCLQATQTILLPRHRRLNFSWVIVDVTGREIPTGRPGRPFYVKLLRQMCMHIARCTCTLHSDRVREEYRIRTENIEVECRRRHELSDIEARKNGPHSTLAAEQAEIYYFWCARSVCEFVRAARLGDCTVFVLVKYYLPFGTHREKKETFFSVRPYILFVLSICIVIIICGVLSPYLFNVRISASAHLLLPLYATYLGIWAMAVRTIYTGNEQDGHRKTVCKYIRWFKTKK